MSDYAVLTNQPIVLDNGSGSIKGGFAGEEHPKVHFPSYVGRPKHHKIMAGSVEGSSFIGKKAQELRGLLKLSWPLEHGIVSNWEDMELIWNHFYAEELKVDSEQHPVLLTEAPLNPKSNKEKAAQIFFETFNVPALFVSIQAVLSLYASGRTTGLVLDSGDGVTHAVPVFEGFSIPSSIKRIDLAGRDITEHLQLLLRKSGYAFSTSAEKEVVRTIKEKCCYVASIPSKEEKDSFGKSEDFILPDGKCLKIGAERFRAPELMFHPEIIGDESMGVHQLISNSISKVDMDLRSCLFSNILLSGGTTLLKGFGDRLLLELKKQVPKESKVKIYAPPERKYSTWIGGSILASLSTFKKMWITSEEYFEDPQCIHRKTF